MNWKEFLKPTKKKILSWFALSFLFSYVLSEWLIYVITGGPTICFYGVCTTEYSLANIRFILGFLNFFTLNLLGVAEDATFNPILSIMFLIMHVILYSAGCFIVWYFNVYKKRL